MWESDRSSLARSLLLGAIAAAATAVLLLVRGVAIGSRVDVLGDLLVAAGVGVVVAVAAKLLALTAGGADGTRISSHDRPAVNVSFDRPTTWNVAFGHAATFTDGFPKVLSFAQEEARRLDHDYLGTEHLLLGLLRETDGVAAQVLNNLGVEAVKVRTAVEFVIGRGDRPAVGELGLTPRSKRVIELAIDEARRFGHDHIGTEHLLLGLLRGGAGIAAGVLDSLGVKLDKVRREATAVLSQSTGPGDVEPGNGEV